ncbi:mechanosensitive ion channel family protein [Halobacteriovorax sp.]|uniref:mechanosensitive ion channel family protein n=1 Tax=Halobacteriovorax sp. TaxID=2020862 RepID=UPI00356B1453
MNKVLLSVVALICIFIFRAIIARALNNATSMKIERRRKWFVNLNSFISFLILLTTAILWADELKSLAFSLAAILVAIIIASKEFILNFFGGIFKISQNSFHIGDRIEINGLRGDVIDRSLFSTKVLEIGPGHETHQLTGRSIVIPNSIFLSNCLINESHLKNYVLHTFKIPVKGSTDWEASEKLLLEICEKHCSDYFERAQLHFDRIQKTSHLEIPILKPRVHINVISPDQLDLIVRFTAPASLKGRIEQRILKDYLRAKNS